MTDPTGGEGTPAADEPTPTADNETSLAATSDSKRIPEEHAIVPDARDVVTLHGVPRRWDVHDLASLVPWLARFPPSSALWQALPYVAEQIELEEMEGADSSELEDVPEAIAENAKRLIGFLLLAAFQPRAPARVIQGVREMSAAWSLTTEGGARWFQGLVRIFHHPRGLSGSTDEERVGFVLSTLALNGSLKGYDIPAVLRQPSKDQLERACEAIQRTNDGAKRRGRPYSAEGKAHEFALAFGLHPPRQIDLGRLR